MKTVVPARIEDGSDEVRAATFARRFARACRSPEALLIAALFLACLTAVVLLPVYFASRARAAQDALYLRANPLQQDGQTLGAAVDSMATAAEAYLATGEERFLAPYLANHQRLLRTADDARARAAHASPMVRAAVEQALAAAERWQAVADTAIAVRQSGGTPVLDGDEQLATYQAAYAPLPGLLAANRQAALVTLDNIEAARVVAAAAASLIVALVAVAYFRLLNQRRRLRMASERSAAYIRHVMDNLRDPMLVIDARTGLLRDLNRAAEQIAGRPRTELLNMPATDLCPPESHAAFAALLAHTGAPVEVALLSAEGKAVPVEFIGAPATLDGAPAVIASGRDITRRLEDEAEREALLRQAEAARAEAEAASARLIDVLESMNDAFFSFDREWRFLYLNPRAEQLAGRRREEAVGRFLWEVFPDARDATYFLHYQQAIDDQSPQAFETYHPDLGAWFAVTAYPTTDGLAAYWQNITARKLIEADREALLRRERAARAEAEASEQRYRVLAETMPVIVWAARPDGTPDYFNRRFYEYTGLTPAVALPDGWQGAIHPDDLPRARQLWSAPRDGVTAEVEFRLRRSDGAYRWQLGRAVPVRDHAGAIMRWLGACADIDDSRRASEEIRQSRDHLAAIFRSIRDGIVVLSPDGAIATANNAAARMLGYAAPGAIAGRALADLYAELDLRDEHGDPLSAEQLPDKRVRAGAPEAEALVCAAGEGGQRWLEIRATALRDDQGQLENVIMSLRDVTERRQAEELRRVTENLTRSNAALQEFAYVASHDLQEPLRMIASYTQLLQRRYAGQLDADADEFIRYAVDGATRMKQLIQDLLAYSRVETRAGELQPVDCNALVQQVLVDLGVAIAEANATIHVGPLPTVLGDPTQLRQVFQNLIGNAVKFRGEAPPIVRVCAERRGAEYLFTVADNGIGIDPRYAERIFVVFQRLHTREAYPGTGIGLALCKKIVERHGGRIWVESRLGAGARFHFVLPALAEEVASVLPERAGVNACTKDT